MVFADLKFVFGKFPFGELRDLEKLVGTRVFSVNKEVSYLVLPSGKEVDASDSNYQKALELGIPVVCGEFVKESVQRGEILPVKEYLIKVADDSEVKVSFEAPCLESHAIPRVDLSKYPVYEFGHPDSPPFPEEKCVVVRRMLLERPISGERQVVSLELHAAQTGPHEYAYRLFSHTTRPSHQVDQPHFFVLGSICKETGNLEWPICWNHSKPLNREIPDCPHFGCKSCDSTTEEWACSCCNNSGNPFIGAVQQNHVNTLSTNLAGSRMNSEAVRLSLLSCDVCRAIGFPVEGGKILVADDCDFFVTEAGFALVESHFDGSFRHLDGCPNLGGCLKKRKCSVTRSTIQGLGMFFPSDKPSIATLTAGSSFPAMEVPIVKGDRLCISAESFTEAEAVFVQLFKVLTSPKERYRNAYYICPPPVGSPAALRTSSSSIKMNPTVSSLMEAIFGEVRQGGQRPFLTLLQADKELSSQLTNPALSLPDVIAGEAILEAIRTVLLSSAGSLERAALEKLSAEFYRKVPMRVTSPIMDLGRLEKIWELIVLLKDVLRVEEVASTDLDLRFSCLRAQILHVRPDTEAFTDLKEMVENRQEDADLYPELKLLRAFSVNRADEDMEFQASTGNLQLLFHGTAAPNLAGILSRGLLLPKVVVARGGTRTDCGLLGQGCYFARDPRVSAKYSTPIKRNGPVLMFLCRVALGKVFATATSDPTLTAPPIGHDSVHGTPGEDFKDDEFCIYNTCQVRIEHLVEVDLAASRSRRTRRTPPLPPQSGVPPASIERPQDYFSSAPPARLAGPVSARTAPFELSPSQMAELEPVAGEPVPDSPEGPSLQTTSGKPLPLKGVHVRGKVLDVVAEIMLFQDYYNDSQTAIEAKYVFPLDGMAAVCGFEAFINGKHVIGKVKEKSVAHKEYREAIAAGKGAYLMDEEEEGDVFTVSVGNIPPLATVLIKITYVSELRLDGPYVVYTLPAGVAPMAAARALGGRTQNDLAVEKLTSLEGWFSLELALTMAFPIEQVDSLHHPLTVKLIGVKGTVKIADAQPLEEDFVCRIKVATPFASRIWVEEAEDGKRQASMVVFAPLMDYIPHPSPVFFILLDRSGSMGAGLEASQRCAKMLLRQLPRHGRFNIIGFGSNSAAMFPCAVPVASLQARAMALDYINKMEPNYGATLCERALGPIFTESAIRKQDAAASSELISILLLTDGQVHTPRKLMQFVQQHAMDVKVFPIACGDTVSRHTLRSIARFGTGALEEAGSRPAPGRCRSIIARQVKRAIAPGLTQIDVAFEGGNLAEAEQRAPFSVSSLFHGEKKIIYALVDRCYRADLKARCATHMLKTTAEVFRRNTLKKESSMIHTLAAKALIRDWDEGLLSEDEYGHAAKQKEIKDSLIDLSCAFNVLSQWTSFVAVEEREENEERSADALQISDLLELSQVDEIDYVPWEEDIVSPVSVENDAEVTVLQSESGATATGGDRASVFSIAPGDDRCPLFERDEEGEDAELESSSSSSSSESMNSSVASSVSRDRKLEDSSSDYSSDFDSSASEDELEGRCLLVSEKEVEPDEEELFGDAEDDEDEEEGGWDDFERAAPKKDLAKGFFAENKPVSKFSLMRREAEKGGVRFNDALHSLKKESLKKKRDKEAVPSRSLSNIVSSEDSVAKTFGKRKQSPPRPKVSKKLTAPPPMMPSSSRMAGSFPPPPPMSVSMPSPPTAMAPPMRVAPPMPMMAPPKPVAMAPPMQVAPPKPMAPPAPGGPPSRSLSVRAPQKKKKKMKKPAKRLVRAEEEPCEPEPCMCEDICEEEEVDAFCGFGYASQSVDGLMDSTTAVMDQPCMPSSTEQPRIAPPMEQPVSRSGVRAPPPARRSRRRKEDNRSRGRGGRSSSSRGADLEPPKPEPVSGKLATASSTSSDLGGGGGAWVKGADGSWTSAKDKKPMFAKKPQLKEKAEVKKAEEKGTSGPAGWVKVNGRWARPAREKEREREAQDDILAELSSSISSLKATSESIGRDVMMEASRLDELDKVMLQNIDSVLARGDRLENIMDRSEPLSVPSGVWGCPACTYENTPSAPSCEICGGPRPAAPLGDRARQFAKSRDEISRAGVSEVFGTLPPGIRCLEGDRYQQTGGSATVLPSKEAINAEDLVEMNGSVTIQFITEKASLRGRVGLGVMEAAYVCEGMSLSDVLDVNSFIVWHNGTVEGGFGMDVRALNASRSSLRIKPKSYGIGWTPSGWCAIVDGASIGTVIASSDVGPSYTMFAVFEAPGAVVQLSVSQEEGTSMGDPVGFVLDLLFEPSKEQLAEFGIRVPASGFDPPLQAVLLDLVGMMLNMEGTDYGLSEGDLAALLAEAGASTLGSRLHELSKWSLATAVVRELCATATENLASGVRLSSETRCDLYFCRVTCVCRERAAQLIPGMDAFLKVADRVDGCLASRLGLGHSWRAVGKKMLKKMLKLA